MKSSSEQKQNQAIQKRNVHIIKTIAACIVLVLVFVGGFTARGNNELLTQVGLSALSVKQEVNPGATINGSTYNSLAARVAEVQGIIAKDSVDSYDLNSATTLLLDAFVQSLNDPYARYYDAASYKAYLTSVSNPSSGVGVLFGENNGTCFAIDVFEGSEAANSGVLVGDIIESIDGEKRDQWTLPDVANALSRDEGEVASISWRRPSTDAKGGFTTHNTSLRYVNAPETNISYTLDNGTAIIQIKQITADCAEVLKQTIEAAEAAGAQSIVLDLRNISGGYLTQAVEIGSMFITSGTIMQVKTGDTISSKTADGAQVTSLPLAVLVNDKTAGAAEVLAMALQDSRRATIVGTQTQGKGTVQVMQPLSFGGALRYTVGIYLSSTGRSIDGVGITPDVVIANDNRQVPVALEVVATSPK